MYFKKISQFLIVKSIILCTLKLAIHVGGSAISKDSDGIGEAGVRVMLLGMWMGHVLQ